MAHGHTPSIMDYARFNYVAQPEDNIPREGIFPRIGDYDCWAIEWGYKPMFDAHDDISDHLALEALTSARLKNNRRLWFGDGETNRTNDARCQTEDLGDDAMKASYYGILNLKRELKQLPKWTQDSTDIYGNNLNNVYNQVIGQFMRYCNHVMRNIGSVYTDYKAPNEAGAVYSDEPRAKQQAAFEFINENVFKEPRWLIDVDYMQRIAPNPQAFLNNVGGNVVMSMLSTGLLNRLTDTYPASQYVPAVIKALFSELATGKQPSAYRRALQIRAVKALTAYYPAYSGRNESAAVVLQQLKQLQRNCHAASSQAHYAALADMIDRALVVK